MQETSGTTSLVGITPDLVLGRYERVRRDTVGAPTKAVGGITGMVIKARDTTSRQFVAIKCIPPNVDKAEARKRSDALKKEISALERLGKHPAVCALIQKDVTSDGMVTAVVLEWAEGESVFEAHGGLIQNSLPLHLGTTLDILEQLAHALTYAHEQNVTNNDLAARHLFWDSRKQQVKIIDWGNAILCATNTKADVDAKANAVRAELDQFGELMYHLLTGQKRELADLQARGTSSDWLTELQAEMKEHHIPQSLYSVITRCWGWGENPRYETAKELTDELSKTRAQLEDSHHQALKRASSLLDEGKVADSATSTEISNILSEWRGWNPDHPGIQAIVDRREQLTKRQYQTSALMLARATLRRGQGAQARSEIETAFRGVPLDDSPRIHWLLASQLEKQPDAAGLLRTSIEAWLDDSTRAASLAYRMILDEGTQSESGKAQRKELIDRLLGRVSSDQRLSLQLQHFADVLEEVLSQLNTEEKEFRQKRPQIQQAKDICIKLRDGLTDYRNFAALPATFEDRTNLESSDRMELPHQQLARAFSAFTKYVTGSDVYPAVVGLTTEAESLRQMISDIATCFGQVSAAFQTGDLAIVVAQMQRVVTLDPDNRSFCRLALFFEESFAGALADQEPSEWRTRLAKTDPSWSGFLAPKPITKEIAPIRETPPDHRESAGGHSSGIVVDSRPAPPATAESRIIGLMNDGLWDEAMRIAAGDAQNSRYLKGVVLGYRCIFDSKYESGQKDRVTGARFHFDSLPKADKKSPIAQELQSIMWLCDEYKKMINVQEVLLGNLEGEWKKRVSNISGSGLTFRIQVENFIAVGESWVASLADLGQRWGSFMHSGTSAQFTTIFEDLKALAKKPPSVKILECLMSEVLESLRKVCQVIENARKEWQTGQYELARTTLAKTPSIKGPLGQIRKTVDATLDGLWKPLRELSSLKSGKLAPRDEEFRFDQGVNEKLIYIQNEILRYSPLLGGPAALGEVANRYQMFANAAGEKNQERMSALAEKAKQAGDPFAEYYRRCRMTKPATGLRTVGTVAAAIIGLGVVTWLIVGLLGPQSKRNPFAWLSRPTATATATQTPTSTATATRTLVPTSTSTATSTKTRTATATQTWTPSPTPSETPTQTPTVTASPTPPATAIPTVAPTGAVMTGTSGTTDIVAPVGLGQPVNLIAGALAGITWNYYQASRPGVYLDRPGGSWHLNTLLNNPTEDIYAPHPTGISAAMHTMTVTMYMYEPPPSRWREKPSYGLYLSDADLPANSPPEIEFRLKLDPESTSLTGLGYAVRLGDQSISGWVKMENRMDWKAPRTLEIEFRRESIIAFMVDGQDVAELSMTKPRPAKWRCGLVATPNVHLIVTAAIVR